MVTGCRPGGSSSMIVMSRSPKTTMAAVRGNGRGRHHQQVGVATGPVGTPALGPQGGPLLDAEAVLLVDDHDAEGAEADLVGEQGMGADEDVDGPVGQSGVEAGPLAWRPVRLVSRATRRGRSALERAGRRAR